MKKTLTQLLVGQAPGIIGYVQQLLLQGRAEGEPAPTSEEIIAAFEQVFTDSASRDAFLVAALEAEIAARKTPTLPA
jgi:hypothetical protein